MGPKEALIYHYVVRELGDFPQQARKYLAEQPETDQSRFLLMLKAEMSDGAVARKIHELVLKQHPTFSPASYALALSEYQHGRIDSAYRFLCDIVQAKWINFNAWDLVIHILDKKRKTTKGLESLTTYFGCIQFINFLWEHADGAKLTSISNYFEQFRREQVNVIFNVPDNPPNDLLHQLIDLKEIPEFDHQKSLKVPIEEADSFLYFINRILVENNTYLDSCSKLLDINENRLGHLLEYWLAKGLIHERIFILSGNDFEFSQGEKAYLLVLETDPIHPGALHGLATLNFRKYLCTQDEAYFTAAERRLDKLSNAHGREFGRVLRGKMDRTMIRHNLNGSSS
jgi:hypothetical protein